MLENVCAAGLGGCLSAESSSCHSRAADLADPGNAQPCAAVTSALPHLRDDKDDQQRLLYALCNDNARYLLQACGCTADVTDENVEEGEVDKLVKGLVQQVSQVSHTYV